LRLLKRRPPPSREDEVDAARIVDRNKIVQLYGGPSLATPTCQPIAPGLPGYTRYCPYTLHPNATGA
jgi:hypothetical protein